MQNTDSRNLSDGEPSPDRRNVILTGFMATGKSVVGRVLAARLGFEWVDTDSVIEARHGSIAEIFATRGENEFRRLEREVASEFAGREGLVVSTGGAMMLDPANAELLCATGRVFCLVASLNTILQRVTDSATDRPLLAGPDSRQRIIDLLEARAAGYGRFTTLDTTGRSVVEVAEDIVVLLADEDDALPGVSRR